jgi:hypothetical protein
MAPLIRDRHFVLRCARDRRAPRPTAASCEEPTSTCGRIRSIVSGLLFTMKTATRTCKPSARGAMRSRHSSLPALLRSFPRKRESRVACSRFVIWVPAFAGTNGWYTQPGWLYALAFALNARRPPRAAAAKGGAYFAGLGFELRSGAPPGLNPKLPSSSSAA